MNMNTCKVVWPAPGLKNKFTCTRCKMLSPAQGLTDWVPPHSLSASSAAQGSSRTPWPGDQHLWFLKSWGFGKGANDNITIYGNSFFCNYRIIVRLVSCGKACFHDICMTGTFYSWIGCNGLCVPSSCQSCFPVGETKSWQWLQQWCFQL